MQFSGYKAVTQSTWILIAYIILTVANNGDLC